MPVARSENFRTDRLVQRRKQLGIKARDFAALCGISAVQLSRIETGGRGVTSDMLVTFCKNLSCSADWLLGLSNDVSDVEIEHWLKITPKF